MAEISQTTNSTLQQQQQQQQQRQQHVSNNEEKENDNIDNKQTIKFIEDRLYLSFDEENAQKLFDFYVLDKKDYNLQPPDVRKLLFDILTAAKWPLVVPDETLDNVLHELCLNEKSMITWVEFKAFFVFLEDRPLIKLFQIATKICNKQQLEFARLIHMKPVNGDIEHPTYDRALFQQKLGTTIPEATSIFLYFLGGGSLLALIVGNFNAKLSENQIAEIVVDNITYSCEMRQFDIIHDTFPPLARAGGIKSKVARKIADTYIVAKQWDEQNLKVASTTKRLVHQASEKWHKIDEKFKIQEKASEFTQKTIDNIREFDTQHQISKQIGDTAKTVDTKYHISETFQSTMNKLQSSSIFQSFSQKLEQFAKDSIHTVEDITKETQQLVQEKSVDSQLSQNENPTPLNNASNTHNVNNNENNNNNNNNNINNNINNNSNNNNDNLHHNDMNVGENINHNNNFQAANEGHNENHDQINQQL